MSNNYSKTNVNLSSFCFDLYILLNTYKVPILWTHPSSVCEFLTCGKPDRDQGILLLACEILIYFFITFD